MKTEISPHYKITQEYIATEIFGDTILSTLKMKKVEKKFFPEKRFSLPIPYSFRFPWSDHCSQGFGGVTVYSIGFSQKIELFYLSQLPRVCTLIFVLFRSNSIRLGKNETLQLKPLCVKTPIDIIQMALRTRFHMFTHFDFLHLKLLWSLIAISEWLKQFVMCYYCSTRHWKTTGTTYDWFWLDFLILFSLKLLN